MNPKEKEQNRKLVEMFKDELNEVIRINLSENRVVEVRIWEDGKVRVSLCIGSETIWIDEEIKGQEYSISATDTTGGYPAGTFHVWGDSTTFVPADIPEEGIKRGLFGDENINILVWKCTPEFRRYREAILEEERRLNIRIPDEIFGMPYGRDIARCLYYRYCGDPHGEPCKNESKQKFKGDMYEYWTLLMLVELFQHKKKGPIEVSQGKYSSCYQVKLVDASIFIKPNLPSYRSYIDKIKENYFYRLSKELSKLIEGSLWIDQDRYYSVPHKPDILVSEPTLKLEDLENIMWDYMKWKEIKPKTKFLIECKAGKLTAEGLGRIFWCSLAYNVPIIIFSAREIDRSLKNKINSFKRRTRRDIYVFDGFKIGERKKWLNALSILLFGHEYQHEMEKSPELGELLGEIELDFERVD